MLYIIWLIIRFNLFIVKIIDYCKNRFNIIFVDKIIDLLECCFLVYVWYSIIVNFIVFVK